MANDNKLDFAKSIERLEEITSAIEDGHLPLEESLKLYDEGKKIIKELEQALKQAEAKVKELDEVEQSSKSII